MLPNGVTASQLQTAVAASQSWRGVLRHLGMTSPRAGRRLRDACDALGISYGHFYGMRGLTDATFKAAVQDAASWAELVGALGYAAESGSARASIRRRAAGLGVDLAHLQAQPGPGAAAGPFTGVGDPRHLRGAAAFLVAAKCALLGHSVSWPLEPTAYDLLVDTGLQGLLRVQVKSGTSRVNDAWIAWITRGSGASGDGGSRRFYSREDIDYFGVVDGDQHVYMIPVSEVEGRASLVLRGYEKYRLAA